MIMSELSAAEEMARRLVLTMLGSNLSPTSEQIRRAIDSVIPVVAGIHPVPPIDAAGLTRRIEADCNVWIESPTTLSDEGGHLEWLTGARRDSIKWNFWNRYRRYLEDYKGMPPNTVRSLNEITDTVLGLLEAPERPGPWDRRGMVVGQVQSGKTSNYIGLICKAADAGYRLIVVLAGVHNSLRSQTQLRLDEGFLGFDTQKRMLFDQGNARIGVGAMPGAGLFIAHALTSSADDGDFKLGVAKSAGVMVGGADPVILVVKKYKSVLENLIKYATAVLKQEHPTTGAMVVRDVPLLVIDDEADHASVNTAPEAAPDEEEVEPRAINRLIRQLLGAFDKSAYVGYTATPFANIFIRPPQEEASRYGEDLFPRSFILSLKAPSDYLGPSRVFGLPDDWRAGTEEQPGLPVVRQAADYSGWIPDKHKKEFIPGALPESMHQALRSFILACAARRARGQGGEHNSMLIHVTRFTDVQARVCEQVKDELTSIRRRILYGDGASPDAIMAELKKLWESDFEPTTRQMRMFEPQEVSWNEVRAALPEAVTKIGIRQINGRAEDILDYFGHSEGISVIAVGGDKLSRGLTLEGLTVSYYLRASRMYDTLMQMGRWFGYRPRYADLCRLYTTPELKSWYKHIALADVELRREFDYMRLLNKTPLEYGLRVRSHPDALMVTSRAKMRSSVDMDLSFAGTISETVVFYRDEGILERNWVAGTDLVKLLGKEGPSGGKGGTRVWANAPYSTVTAFLRSYRTHESATKAQSEYLCDYIEAQQRHDELTAWTVALISSQAASAVPFQIGVNSGGFVERGENGTTDIDSHIAIKRLVSPHDEGLDLSDLERDHALHLTIDRFTSGLSRSRRTEPPVEPDGLAIRMSRPSQRGLLLIYPIRIGLAKPPTAPPDEPSRYRTVLGFAISFPHSDTAQSISYRVNPTYWDTEIASE